MKQWDTQREFQSRAEVRGVRALRLLRNPRDTFLRDFSLNDLRTTLAVAETGSFRRAAERLAIGQSVVSRRVQKLEDELGVSLFERSSAGASLTVAGSAFVRSSRTVLQEIQAAFTDARSAGIAATGLLRIGLIAPLSGGAMRHIVEAFLKHHPHVDLSFNEGDRSDLLTRLSHRRIDALFAAGEPLDGDPEMMLVTKERIYLALPENDAKAGIGHLSWREVAKEIFLTGNDEAGVEVHDYIKRRIRDCGHRVAVRHMDIGREGIMTLVGLGIGVSLVAENWRGVSYPGVVFIPFGEEAERLPFSLTWRQENDNPALRRFISLARIEAKRAAVAFEPS